MRARRGHAHHDHPTGRDGATTFWDVLKDVLGRVGTFWDVFCKTPANEHLPGKRPVSNERLKTAMDTAAITADELAERVDVDPKTIERWVSGRTPHRRYRLQAAHALGVAPADLWPDTDKPAPPPSNDDEDEQPDDDLDAAYPTSEDPAAPNLTEMLTSAETRIDLLDATWYGLASEPDIRGALTARADAGVGVRLLISDPDSAYLLALEHEARERAELTDEPILAWEVEKAIGYLQPLLSHPRIEARTFVAAPANAITTVDDQMLVRLHLAGAPAQVEPLLALTRRHSHGLYDRFAHHLQVTWHDAVALTADPDRYPDPDQHPDRYAPTLEQDPARYGPFGPTAPAFSATETTAPRSSRRRRR